MKTTTKNKNKNKVHLMSKKELNIKDVTIKYVRNGCMRCNIDDLRANKNYFNSLKIYLNEFGDIVEHNENESTIFVNSGLFDILYEGFDIMLSPTHKEVFNKLSKTQQKIIFRMALIEASKGVMVRNKTYTNSYVMEHTTKIQPVEVFRCIGRLIFNRVDLVEDLK